MESGQQKQTRSVSGIQRGTNSGKPQGRRYVKRSVALAALSLILLHSVLGNNGSEARTRDDYSNHSVPVAKAPPVLNTPSIPSVVPQAQAAESPAAVRVVDGVVRKGDSLTSLLTRYGVTYKTALNLAGELRKESKLARQMQIDDDIRLIFGADRQLLLFGYQTTEKSLVRATVERDGGFAIKTLNAKLPSLDEAAIRQLFPHLFQLAGIEKPAGKSAEKEVAKSDSVAPPLPSPLPLAPVADVSLAKDVKVGDKLERGITSRIDALVKTGSASLVKEVVRKGDGLTDVLGRRSVPHETTLAIAKAAKPVYDIASQLTPGKTLNLAMGEDGGLMGIGYAVDPEHTFWLVGLTADGKISEMDANQSFVPRLEQKVLETRATSVAGTIQSSLFEDGRKAGLSHTMLAKLAGLFEWDVDFARDIQKGDEFKVVFEEKYHKGKRVNSGVILAAEFVNQGKVYRVARFADATGKVGYFTPDGKSIRRMFIKAPMDFTRVSSGFSSSRLHPVFGFHRAHKGVDYAAPTGTPVRASGDGTIESVGTSNGFGNLILVRHNAKYTTAYAHLSRFASGMKTGARVSQGQTIGFVGSTGVATGPHLHYELRVNGTQVNPLTVQSAAADAVDRKQMASFRKNIAPYVAMLDSAGVMAAVDGDTKKD